MNPINLEVRGLAIRNPLKVTIDSRTLLVAPNESGKSTILNCLRAWAVGKANMDSGNTPGALLTYCPPGAALSISGSIGETGSVANITKAGQQKVNIPVGWDCMHADLLGLDGTASKVKAFFAEFLKPDPKWTRAAVQSEILSRLSNICNPDAGKFSLAMGRDVIDSLSGSLKIAKAATSRAKAARDEAETLMHAATKDTQMDSLETAGSKDELLTKRSDLQAREKNLRERIEANDKNVRDYNRAQEAAKSARELYEKHCASEAPAVQSDFSVEQAKFDAEVANRDAAKNRVAELKSDVNNAEQAAENLRKQLGGADFSEIIANFLNQTKCATCTEQFNNNNKIHAERLAQWKKASDVVAAAKFQLSQAEQALASADRNLEAARRNFTKAQDDATNAAKIVKLRNDNIANSEKAWRAAASVAESFTAPTPSEELKTELAEVTAEIDKLKDPIAVATKREEGRAQAARAREEFEKKKAAVDAAKAVEDAVAAVRDEVMRAPAAQLAAVCRRFAGALGAQDVVLDPGDGESDPTIGARVLGVPHVVDLSAFSAGKRSIFLASVAAALLERSEAPQEKRILLIEAGALDSHRLVDMLHSIGNTNIGYIVVAWHCAEEYLTEFRRFAADELKWSTPDWIKENANASA